MDLELVYLSKSNQDFFQELFLCKLCILYMYFAGLLGCFLSNKRQNVLFDPTKIFCGKIYENIIFESINCLVIYTQKMPQLNQQLKVQIEDGLL